MSASIEVASIALVETSNTDAAPRGGDREKRALRRLRRRPRQVPLLREQSKGTSTMSFAGLPNDDERGKVAETGGNWRTSASLAMHGGFFLLSALVSGATAITVACLADRRTPESRGVRVLCGDTECFTGRATMAGARDSPATEKSASTD